jgi:Zn-dependent protease
MLGVPEATAYDLRFRLLNIPVRVNPWFWIVMLFISRNASDPTGRSLMPVFVFVACAFVSILVHEFGHALSARGVGREPGGIVLYGMGGLCFYENGGLSPLARVLILAAGPGAGFALLGLVLGLAKTQFGIEPADAMALIDVGSGDAGRAVFTLMNRSPALFFGLHFLLYINFWWGVFNLLPIWPLDGGQITGVVLGVVNPRQGTRWAHIVALFTAGGIAVWFASRDQFLMAVWVGYFGYINYQMLQSLQRAYGYVVDDDRWRR